MSGPCSKCCFPLERGECQDDPSGVTVLMIAGGNGHEECLKAWIGVGADVNAVNMEGDTALIIASSWGNSNCMNVLIKAGADVNVAANDGTTALLAASWSTSVEPLLQAGADLKATDKEGNTSLILAARGGHMENLEKFLAIGVDVKFNSNFWSNGFYVSGF